MGLEAPGHDLSGLRKAFRWRRCRAVASAAPRLHEDTGSKACTRTTWSMSPKHCRPTSSRLRQGLTNLLLVCVLDELPGYLFLSKPTC